ARHGDRHLVPADLDELEPVEHVLGGAARQSDEALVVEDRDAADQAAGDVGVARERAHQIARTDTLAATDREEELDFVRVHVVVAELALVLALLDRLGPAGRRRVVVEPEPY